MKGQNRAVSFFFGDWIVWTLALVTALFIVISVRYLNVTDRVVTVALEVILPEDQNIIPESLIPETVNIVITGEDKIIYLVDPGQVKAKADFSNVTTSGISVSSVVLEYKEDIFTRAGLTVDARPSTVRILFQNINTPESPDV